MNTIHAIAAGFDEGTHGRKCNSTEYCYAKYVGQCKGRSLCGKLSIVAVSVHAHA